jgi:hypothetical protein
MQANQQVDPPASAYFSRGNIERPTSRAQRPRWMEPVTATLATIDEQPSLKPSGVEELVVVIQSGIRKLGNEVLIADHHDYLSNVDLAGGLAATVGCVASSIRFASVRARGFRNVRLHFEDGEECRRLHPRWLSASTTAFWIEGVAPIVPDSPIPLAPNTFSGVGVSVL